MQRLAMPESNGVALEEELDTAPVESILNHALNSSDQPLDPHNRAFMGSRFGHDFTPLRVHHDGGSPGPGVVQRDEDEGWLSKIGGAISGAGSAVASGVGGAIDAGESLASSAGSAIASGVGSVVDTGESLASGAASAIGSGVSSVVDAGSSIASGVGSVAGKAWQGAKTAAGDVADFGKDVYGQMKEDAGYVQKGVGAVGSGVDWLENKAKAGTSWVADKASGIPVLSQIANAGKSYVDLNVDVLGGAAKGVTGLAGGLLSAAADPVDTAKALYTMSEHIPGMGMPQKLLGGAYDLAQGKSLGDVADETLNPMNDLKYWGNVGKGLISPYQQAIAEGKPGEALGRGAVDIGSLFLGVGEAGEASKVAQVAEAADAAKVGDVAEAAKLADAADASKAADVADAGKATSVPPEPVQVPVDPNVNPTAPTQLPPGPTELPPHPPLSPDYLENPGFRQSPAPVIEPPPPGGFPKLPNTPASPIELGPSSALEEGTAVSHDATEAAEHSTPLEAEPQSNPAEAPSPSEAAPEEQSVAPEAVDDAAAVQRGRGSRLRDQSGYRDVKMEALKEEVAGGIWSPETAQLAEDRGLNVPTELAEGETSLGEAQVNVHHKTSLAEDPTQAANPENLELLDAQGGGSAHAAGAHGNDFARQRSGLAADPDFDQNLGFQGDKRRGVPSLDDGLESVMDEKSLHDFETADDPLSYLRSLAGL